MTNDALLGFAEARGYNIFYRNMEETRAITIERAGCHIALALHMEQQEEKETLAHELGHCEYGGTYNRCSPFDIKAKAEYRADKWAYAKLVPVRKLKSAIRKGVCTPWELADLFDVDCKYMIDVVEFYKKVGQI